MRAKYLFATMVFAIPGIALAQNAPTPTNPPAESVLHSAPPVPASDATLQNSLPVTVLFPGEYWAGDDILTRRPPKLGGALARASRARQPWQAINPFAPMEFGQGYENVTEDLHTHQPKGIVLVSFGSSRRQ
jgi:hypothetical protein